MRGATVKNMQNLAVQAQAECLKNFLIEGMSKSMFHLQTTTNMVKNPSKRFYNRLKIRKRLK